MCTRNSAFYIFLLIIVFTSCRNIDRKNLSDITTNDQTDTISDESLVKKFINRADTSWHNELGEFYGNRNFSPAWFENERISKNASILENELKNSVHQGLDPYSYNIQIIDSLIHESDTHKMSSFEAARTDVLLSVSFLEYASDLMSGRINPDSLDIAWESYPEKRSPAEYLSEALKNNSVAETLYNLRPHNEIYYRLLEALETLSDAKWPLPGYFPAVKLNARNRNVLKLKKFLAATNDLDPDDSTYLRSPIFDARLKGAVIKFQERNGLKPDGMAGKETLNAMNVPLNYRLAQVQVNIDRIRMLPSDLGERFIIVNIPGYYLEYYEKNKMKLRMNVVVGKIENYTPVLKDTMTTIVFNPAWNVPNSIAIEEILPKIKADPEYLEQNNYILLKGSYSSSDTIDPSGVKWADIDTASFPFSIVQKRGGNNPLGRVKFLFPNNFDIYLHDSPARELFSLDKRDFSHGCIRLEKPLGLAEILLQGQMNESDIENILSGQETRNVALDKKVLVHFMYQTAWVDQDGSLQFRKDIYNIDRESISLLGKDTSKEKRLIYN